MNTRPFTKAGSVLAAVSALLVIGVPSAGANLSFTPANHNFGNQTVGTTGGQTFTLTATCDQVVVVSCVQPVGGIHTTNLGIAGTGFALGTTSCGVVLNASASTPASCTVEVLFTPTSAGAKTGSLTAGLAASGNDITAALTGNGVAPLVPPAGGGDPPAGQGGTQGAVTGKKKKCKKPKRRAAAAAKKCRKK
jgi:hypothetical protein